jgi:hypothetical protein
LEMPTYYYFGYTTCVASLLVWFSFHIRWPLVAEQGSWKHTSRQSPFAILHFTATCRMPRDKAPFLHSRPGGSSSGTSLS